MKHTPGPWKISSIQKNSEIKPRPKNYIGDQAYIMTDREYPTGVLIATVRENYINECEANAALIASAPELLEELKQSNHALMATYQWMFKNCKDLDGAKIIGAMLKIQATKNEDAIEKAEMEAE